MASVPRQVQGGASRNGVFAPAAIRNFAFLPQEERIRLEGQLQALWTSHDSLAEGTAERGAAFQRIGEFCHMLVGRAKNTHMQRQQSQGQTQGQGPARQPQPPQQQQQQAQQGTRSFPNTGPAQVNQGSAGSPPGASGDQGHAGQQRPQSRPTGISEHIIKYVAGLKFVPSPQFANDAEKSGRFIQECQQKYVTTLTRMENAATRQKQFEGDLQRAKAQGNHEMASRLQANIHTCQKAHVEAKKGIEQLNLHVEWKKPAGNPGQQNNGTAGGPVQQQNSSIQAAAANGAGVSSGIDGVNPGQQQMRAVPGANGDNQAAGAVTGPPSQGSLAAAPTGNAPAVIKVEPHTQPHHPAPVNTALAAAAAIPRPAESTPTQNNVQHPLSSGATSIPGHPKSYSVSVAINKANETYTNSLPNAALNVNGGTPSSGGGMAGAGVMGQSSRSHGPSTGEQRMPIPKQLPEKATAVPTGVSIGGGVMPGRPTMNASSVGVMGQPAVQKIPAYVHETEGDRVLSKKKLDELVRQVSGGTAEGQEGNLLTPDVEEVMPFPSLARDMR